MTSRKQWAAWGRFKKQRKAQAAQSNARPKKNEARPNVIVDEVIISTEDMRKITWAWLYADVPQERRQRLCWLMFLYSNPNVKELAKRLEITPKELLDALVELKKL